jgi:acetyltransferase-like isoleucine patch superfamily enzyme
MNKIRNSAIKVRNNIVKAILYAPALVRGTANIFYYSIFRKNVKIGFPFLAFAKVTIVGPGTVTIDKGCHAQKNVFRGLTIVTRSVDSSVSIGAKSLLGGLTIRCHDRIELGKKTMTAVSLLQDSLFYNANEVSSQVDTNIFLRPDPVIIGSNVWLGPESIVLGGSRIGNDNVFAAGTWCFKNQIGDYCLVSGNPAKRPLPIVNLLKLKGMG